MKITKFGVALGAVAAIMFVAGCATKHQTHVVMPMHATGMHVGHHHAYHHAVYHHKHVYHSKLGKMSTRHDIKK